MNNFNKFLFCSFEYWELNFTKWKISSVFKFVSYTNFLQTDIVLVLR